MLTLQRISPITKATLSRLQSGYRSSNALNANLAAIEDAIENTLSRDGTSPNQMEAELDMNANKIINLAAPTAGSDAARLTDVLAVSPGTGINTFLVTPSSANLAAAVTDETGTGLLVFNTSPTLVTPALGTPASGTLTNATGLPIAGLVASTSTPIGVGSIELGHATDTTLSRPSAGDVAVEGNIIYRAGGTDVPVTDGGTGASTSAGALTNFGVSAFVQTLLGTANHAAFLAAFGQIDIVETDFTQAGTGAVTVTGQDKLRQAPVQPNSGEFGLFTNATVTTATLLAAFTAAMADGRAVELAGSYTINGPITPTIAVDGAELRIILRDNVTITVDAGSTAFDKVFYAESTTPVSHVIGGAGTLTLDCNSKAAAGIWLRHTSTTIGGDIGINAHVHIQNLKAATGITNTTGIMILGRYERIVMRSPTVEGVTRTDAAGECSGIACSGFAGEVEMYSPVIRRVNYGTLGSADADCIKCFGLNTGTANNRRLGSVRIFNPVLEDGQTRLYKDQCGDTIIYSPWIRRRAVDDGLGGTILGSRSGSGSVDFDFQFGGGLVLDAHVEFYKSVLGVSPFSGAHSIYAFQQLVDNSEMYAAAKDTTIITDVAMTRAVQLAEGGSRSITEIDGLKVIPVSGLTTTAFTDAIVEIDIGQILAKTTETIVNVTDVYAPNTSPVIGYRGYVALDSGTATAGGATTLTNSAETWTVDQWANHVVRITSGTGSGQTRIIASNTATVLTVVAAWTVNPDATSVYTISYSATEKLSVRVNNCSTSLFSSSTLAIGDIADNTLRAFKSFEIGDNPGYRNWYQNRDICLKKFRAGSKMSVYLDNSLFFNTDWSTPVNVPWGTTGTLLLMGHGLSNTNTAGNDSDIEARLDAAAPNAWHTHDGGITWRALN